MNKLLISLTIILCMSLILAACSSQSSTTASPVAPAKTTQPVAAAAPPFSSQEAVKTLTIGEIDALTGVYSNIMKYVPQGVEMAKQYINSKGGITINGQKYILDIYLQDSKSTADGATAAANAIVYDKGLKFVCGTGVAVQIVPIDTVTEMAGVMYTAIQLNGLPNEMGPKYPLKFVGSNCTFSAHTCAITWLAKSHPEVKTVAYISVDDGTIDPDTPVIRAAAEKNGLTIIGDTIGFVPSTTDYTPIAQKAVSRNADAIMMGTTSSGPQGLILKGIRALGYKKPVCTGSWPTMTDVAATGSIDNMEGYFGNGLPSDPATPNLPQITQDLLKIAIDKYGSMNNLQVQGFNSLYTMVQAIQTAQSLDPKVVATKWETMTKIDTAFGAGKMGGAKTYGVNHNVYFADPITIIKDGKAQLAGWMSLDQAAMP